MERRLARQEYSCELVVACWTIERYWPSLEALLSDRVYFHVGLHPGEAMYPVRDPTFRRLEKMARHPRCVAIGEIGLDYGKSSDPRRWDNQARFLCRALDLAVTMRKPVVIHARFDDDTDRVYADILRLMAQHLPADHAVYLHCFAGTLAQVQLWTSKMNTRRFYRI